MSSRSATAIKFSSPCLCFSLFLVVVFGLLTPAAAWTQTSASKSDAPTPAGRPFAQGAAGMAADPAHKQAELDPKSDPGLWQAFERALYSLKDNGHGTWQGVNDAQRLTIEFNAHEARLTHPEGSVGFHLVGYGYGEALKTPAAPTLAGDGTRFEYRRGGLTEWYVNGRAGLEQGFTLAEPPAGAGSGQPLTLALGVSGNLALSQQGGTVLLKSGDKVVLRYGGLSARDARGRLLPAHIEARSHEIRMVVDDREAQYPLTVDPAWLQEQELAETTDQQADGSFGTAVSVSGTTVLIGASGHTVNGILHAGAAYIFVLSGGVWTEQAELNAADAVAGDEFGVSVSLSGTLALVGAYQHNRSAGAAYVFAQSGTVWSQQAELNAADAAADDQFGSSVSLSGSLALVGAPGHQVAGQAGAGAAYVFAQSGASWPQQAEFTALDAAAGDNLGKSVSLSGGIALVGATYHQAGSIAQAGAAYLFTQSGATWTQQQELTAPDAAGLDEFGSTVSMSGSTAVVGAPYKTVGSNQYAGAAYVFAAGNPWTQQAELTASNGTAFGFFGTAVSVSGNLVAVDNYVFEPNTPTHFSVSAPGSTSIGSPFNLTVTALGASNLTASGYNGTIGFTSTDTAASLPADYTFVPGDAGVHTFTGQATLNTPGNQTITATDTGSPSLTGTSGSIAVTYIPVATSIVFSTPATAWLHGATSFTVEVLDQYGYSFVPTGNVTFTSTDGAAGLPGPLSPAQLTSGPATVSITFNTTGSHTITATGSADGVAGTSSAIKVSIPDLVVTTNVDDNPGVATNCTAYVKAAHGTGACTLRDALAQAAALGSAQI
jgi:hypothetical protein